MNREGDGRAFELWNWVFHRGKYMPCWIFLALVMEADMGYYGSEKECTSVIGHL